MPGSVLRLGDLREEEAAGMSTMAKVEKYFVFVPNKEVRRIPEEHCGSAESRRAWALEIPGATLIRTENQIVERL